MHIHAVGSLIQKEFGTKHVSRYIHSVFHKVHREKNRLARCATLALCMRYAIQAVLAKCSLCTVVYTVESTESKVQGAVHKGACMHALHIGYSV